MQKRRLLLIWLTASVGLTLAQPPPTPTPLDGPALSRASRPRSLARRRRYVAEVARVGTPDPNAPKDSPDQLTAASVDRSLDATTPTATSALLDAPAGHALIELTSHGCERVSQRRYLLHCALLL